MIEKIYKQYAKQVYTYALYLTKKQDKAEELTQETFYRAVKNIGKFRGECTIGRWLTTITRNLYIEEKKKDKKYAFLPLEQIENIEDDCPPIEEFIQEKQEKKWLYEKIEQLEEMEKEIILLRAMENLSFKMIGEIVGKSENFVRMKYYRAKKKMIKLQESEEIKDEL